MIGQAPEASTQAPVPLRLRLPLLPMDDCSPWAPARWPSTGAGPRLLFAFAFDGDIQPLDLLVQRRQRYLQPGRRFGL